ncbi:MAG: signal peptidase II [Armatimonadota bacterium]
MLRQVRCHHIERAAQRNALCHILRRLPGCYRRPVRTRYLYIIAISILVLDQLSKYLILSKYSLGISAPIIHNVFHISLLRNNGGAFGIMQSLPWILLFVSAAATVMIVVMLKNKASIPKVVGIALALQLGGALGNLIDRIRLGYVVDFIDLMIWPIFNVADIAITVGVLILAYHLVFHSHADDLSKKKQDA